MIDLLHRFFDPDEAKVPLENIDIRQLDPSELRRQIAVVSQDSIIVAGTVADNIEYARPEASLTEIIRVAKSAEIDAEICAMSEGYDTWSTARGGGLLGGQRQLLSRARVLPQDPIILIRDEVTSSIDRQMAQRIENTMDLHFSNETRIAVSDHREPLFKCDQIVELVGGQFQSQYSLQLSGA